MKNHYDVVVVGARVAGAATAMLMAREGADVLLVDRSAPGADTLSTHALMRGAVLQLDRWGLLDAVVEAGTPAVTRTVFRYPNEEVVVETDPLYAPRRTVLDPIVAEGARLAGVTLSYRTRAVDVGLDGDGTVRDISLDHDGTVRRVSTDLLVGADGLNSWVARRLDVPVTRRGAAASGTIMAYVDDSGLRPDTYVWAYSPGRLAGAIPTNEGQHVVFVSMPSTWFRRQAGRGADVLFREQLAVVAPELADAMSGGNQVGRLRTWPGHVGQFRKAHGRGWALVGDAGYFKDPGAAHGITDAFRDAELLTRAVASGDLGAYERMRNDLSLPLFGALERVVDYSWTMEDLPDRLVGMSKAMKVELAAFGSLLEVEGLAPSIAA